MPKYFKIIEINMSHQQKKSLYNQYCFGVDEGMLPGPKATFKEFTSIPHFNTMVDMKCLACGFTLRVNFSLYNDYMEREDAPFPVDYCSECGKLHFVPLDVYNKLIP